MDQSSTKVRYDFIDFLKGVGIFLVVWGHTMMPRSIYIYSFHMPLFFFLSGFVHKDKPLCQFFLAKVNALYIPYAVFTLLSWLFYLIRYIIYGWYSQIDQHLYKIISLFTGTADNGGNNPIWFLTCIFAVSVGFRLLTQIVRKQAVMAWVIAGMSVVGYVLSIGKISLYFNIDIAFSGIVFYYLGYLVRRKELLADLGRIKRSRLVKILVAAETLHILTAYLNAYLSEISRVNMAGNLLGNYFLFYCSAGLGVFVYVVIGYHIRQLRIFNYLGMNSLLILATHKPLLIMLNSFLDDWLDVGSNWYGFLASITVLGFSMPMIAFVNRKIPQTVGKRPLFNWNVRQENPVAG